MARVIVTADEFRDWLGNQGLTKENASRLFGVTVPTIYDWLRSGITGAPAVLMRVLLGYNLQAAEVAQKLGVTLSPYYSVRAGKPSPTKISSTEGQKSLVLAYLREESAATTAQLRNYFERKTGRPELAEQVLASMQVAGLIACDSKGNWTILRGEPKPAAEGHVWERRPEKQP